MSGLKIMLPMAAVILATFGVLLVILKIAGTGGNNGATPTPRSTAAEMTPSSPTAVRSATAEPTGGSTSPASLRNGVQFPSDPGARTDCPPKWASFTDPDGTFSICFPSDWLLSIDAPHAAWGLGRTLSVGDLSDVGMLIIYGRASSYFTPEADRCSGAPYADDWTDLKVTIMAIGGAGVDACKGHYLAHFAGGTPPQRKVVQFAELPAARPGWYVDFTLTVPEDSSGDASSAKWAAVLATFRR